MSAATAALTASLLSACAVGGSRHHDQTVRRPVPPPPLTVSGIHLVLAGAQDVGYVDEQGYHDETASWKASAEARIRGLIRLTHTRFLLLEGEPGQDRGNLDVIAGADATTRDTTIAQVVGAAADLNGGFWATTQQRLGAPYVATHHTAAGRADMRITLPTGSVLLSGTEKELLSVDTAGSLNVSSSSSRRTLLTNADVLAASGTTAIARVGAGECAQLALVRPGGSTRLDAPLLDPTAGTTSGSVDATTTVLWAIGCDHLAHTFTIDLGTGATTKSAASFDTQPTSISGLPGVLAAVNRDAGGRVTVAGSAGVQTAPNNTGATSVVLIP